MRLNDIEDLPKITQVIWAANFSGVIEKWEIRKKPEESIVAV